jgi:AcrR family transcriptional regulator
VSPRTYRLGQRQLQVEDTRQRILAAARDVLAVDDQFSVDAVAARANVARMTVYNQFGSRAGLLDALFDWLAERGGMASLAEVFTMSDPRLALDAFVATFCGFWASDRLVLRRLRAMAALDPELGTLVHRRDEWRRGGLRRLLGGGPEVVDTVHLLSSFESFDSLAEVGRSAEEVYEVLRRACRRLLGERGVG